MLGTRSSFPPVAPPTPLFIQTTSLDYHAEIDKVCCVLCGHLSHFCANRGERGNFNLKRKEKLKKKQKHKKIFAIF
jgi:hypothetical protein